MMLQLLTCPECGFAKELPPEKLPSGPANVTCPSCRHRFVFSPSESGATGDFEFVANPYQPERSVFVNVLAWIFIFIGGFSTLISIMQNVMLHFMFRGERMEMMARHVEQDRDMPAFFGFMFNHFELYFLLFLVVCMLTFVSAIALLKRKNWARRVFIGLMVLAILWNIGGVIMQFTMLGSMRDFGDADFPAEMQTMMIVMQVFMVLIALAVSVLCGWIIRKLTSAPIRAEFV